MGNHASANNLSSGPPTLKKSSSKNKIVLGEDYAALCQALIEESKADNVGSNISRRVFVKHFNSSHSDGFGELLFEHCVSQQTGLDVHFLTKETLLRVCENLLEFQTDAQRIKLCLSVFSRGKNYLDKAATEHLFAVSYYLASEISNSEIYDVSSPAAKHYLNAIISSAMKYSDTVNTESLCNWIKKNCLNLTSGIHFWVSRRLHQLPSSDSPIAKNSRKPLPAGSGVLLNPVLVWLLSCSLPVIYTKRKNNVPPLQRMLSGHLDPHTYVSRLMNFLTPPRWSPLYNSSVHGLSINRFQNQVFSYRGCTVMLLELDEHHIYCIAVDQEWRESTHKWGEDNCVLMQILPEYKILEAGSKMIYFNVSSRGHVFGLHVGQNGKHPILEIDQEMSVVLVRKIPYKIISVEVWGSAGEDILEAQIKQKRWESREIEKHRKVSLNAVDWQHNPDKYILELGSSKTSGSYLPTS